MTMMKSTTAFSVLRVMRAVRFSEKGIRSAWRDEAAFRAKGRGDLLCGSLSFDGQEGLH